MDQDIAPVPGYPGYYASRAGDIYSARHGWHRRTPYAHHRSGHLALRLGRMPDGSRPAAFVHTLVLLTHVGPKPTPDHECRHLNGNPQDNRVANLAWGTRAENADDAVRHGTGITRRKGESALRARLSERQVLEIERRARAGESDIALAHTFGVSPRSVYGIRMHQTWQHLWAS